jgi:hypothetical protein
MILKILSGGKMSKYWIALILPLSLLTGFSVFSTENFTARQYQLDAETEIVATTDGNDEPIVPGQGRQETSAEKS